jgi:hypothetical protein
LAFACGIDLGGPSGLRNASPGGELFVVGSETVAGVACVDALRFFELSWVACVCVCLTLGLLDIGESCGAEAMSRCLVCIWAILVSGVCVRGSKSEGGGGRGRPSLVGVMLNCGAEAMSRCLVCIWSVLVSGVCIRESKSEGGGGSGRPSLVGVVLNCEVEALEFMVGTACIIASFFRFISTTASTSRD